MIPTLPLFCSSSILKCILCSLCSPHIIQLSRHMSKAESYFGEQFMQAVERVGGEVAERYVGILQQYRTAIIPFQSSRLREHQSLIFQNSTLETDKMELLNRIEKLKAENQRQEYSLQKQSKRIHDLERLQEDLQRLNLDHQSEIASLRLTNDDLTASLERKEGEVSQLQKDKSSLLEKLQAKNGDYNILLANYMKDKNLLAEKLNQMNDLQSSLFEKEKELKAEKFYLQKQWEEFEEAQKNMKNTPTPTPKKDEKKSRIFGNPTKEECLGKEQQEKTQRNSNSQILRTPLKKLVKHHQSQIYELSLNYNGNLLASCGGDRLIKVFDIPNQRPIATATSHSAQSIFITNALSYSGDRLLAGSTDKKVAIFQTETGKELHSFPGHGDKVNSVAWASTKEKCISGSEDKQLKVWDIEKASNILSIACGRSVKVVRSNGVEPVVYTGHGDGSVRVYSATQGSSPVSQVKGALDYPISSITLMSNRQQVLVTSLEGSSCQILDLKMNKSVGKFQHRDFFNSSTHACLSPSEALVLAGNCDGSIYYWNRFKGDMVKKVSGHDGPVTALHYNFMSSTLASADKEGSLILWQ